MASTDLIGRETLRQARADRASHDVARWSARRTLLFVGGASLTLWLVIALLVVALIG